MSLIEMNTAAYGVCIALASSVHIPIGLKVEAAMASAEIKVKLVCPLTTPSFPPGTHDYDPKRHSLIEGVSKCMITRQEAQAMFNEYHEAQGPHAEVYTDGS